MQETSPLLKSGEIDFKNLQSTEAEVKVQKILEILIQENVKEHQLQNWEFIFLK